jgi:acetylornithine deacetylase/succinyl-diaminopimelate desuccinylase family protein
MGPGKEVKKLISIPSITGNEKEIAQYLKKRFEELGCRVKLYEAAKDRFNVYAKIGGSGGGKPALLFHGHIDTVAAYGMESPFSPRERDGKIYGRGSVDQKGGIAAVIEAFKRIAGDAQSPARPIAFVGVIDEESEHRGSMALREMGIAADFAVVTEPSGLKLCIGCKGTVPIRLKVKGRAAHGCRPWLGANAVLSGMRLAELLMKKELPSYSLEGIGEVGASINLGKIEGGRAYNIVADYCDVWFDRRTVPGENPEEVFEGYTRLIEESAIEEGTSAEIEIARPDWNWDPIKKRGLHPALADLNSPQLQRLRQAHRDILGEDPIEFFTDGYQEMDFLVNDLGIDTVHYGPGDSSLCHTDEEYLDIAQLEKCSEVYYRLIRLLND